jgi:hypothetical protein
MWMWMAGLASAAEIPDTPPDAYEERWDRADVRASRVSRTGGYLLAAGFAQAAFGTLLVSYGQERASEDLIAAGGVLLVTGAISGGVSMPITLAGSMRVARSINARGVHAPTAAGVGGWTCFGLSFLVLPAPVTVPLSMVLGLAQVDVNRRVRESAGLPSVRYDTRWWETAPLGVTVTIVPGTGGRASRGDRAPEG